MKQKGFSLLEMLVVLVIMGLLAGLVGPRLMGNVDSSMQKTANTQVSMLKGAIQTMRLDIGRYPSNNEGLNLLVKRPAQGGEKDYWNGPYLDGELPNDPWGNSYQYKLNSGGNQPFLLYSYGADGKDGGEGLDADIGIVE